MLFLEHRGGGEDRREFERHFRLAFREALTTPRGRPVVEWLQGQSEERAPRAARQAPGPFRSGEVATPVLTLLDQLLQRSETRVIVVSADLGAANL